jgi:FAD synthetase
MPTQNRKCKLVLASGVFDLLHLGHVKFLEDAKKAGGKNAKLIVVIARDSTVEQTKGRRPVMPENQRLALVESLKVVDKAVLGLEDLDVGGIIGEVKPDVIALGYDQEEMEQRVKSYVKKRGLPIEVLRVGKFGESEIDSSSKIRQRIVEKYAK